jgi:hypothetical protein
MALLVSHRPHHRTINYISAEDIGYDLRNKGGCWTGWEIDYQKHVEKFGDVDGEKPKAPFVEQIAQRKGPRPTKSGVTSALQVRCSIALACMRQFTDLSDMDDTLLEYYKDTDMPVE